MHSKKHGLFVADDKASDISSSPFFMDLLVRMGHHYKMSNCLIVQDATMPGKTKSVLAKNVHVNVMMRSPRDRCYLRTIGMMMNDYRCIVDSYDDACRNLFSYFIIDTHPASNPELKYRTQIFPTDECCIIYKSNKKWLRGGEDLLRPPHNLCSVFCKVKLLQIYILQGVVRLSLQLDCGYVGKNKG